MSSLDPQKNLAAQRNPVQHAADVPVHQAEWGSLQWMVGGHNAASRNMTIGRVSFKPGQGNPMHRHPNCEEVLYVVTGELEHTHPAGGTVRLHPGDCIVLEPNVWHKAVNVGTDVAIVLVAFNSADRLTETQEQGSEE